MELGYDRSFFIYHLIFQILDARVLLQFYLTGVNLLFVLEHRDSIDKKFIFFRKFRNFLSLKFEFACLFALKLG